MVKRSKSTRRGRGTRKASRTMRRRYKGGQTAPMAAPVVAGAPTTVKVYVTKTPQGINKDTGVSSNNPKVTASATTANSVSLNLDPSLGKLTNWNVEGFASSWKPVDPSKLNRGGVSVTAESGGKGVRRGINPPGFLSASQLKMPLSATSLTVKGLEQSNFQTFSTGGNTSKNGANICITLSFA